MSSYYSDWKEINHLLVKQEVCCPSCQGFNLRPLRYGLGTEGGCVISSNSPKLRCDDCGHTFLTIADIQEMTAGVDWDEDLDEDYLMKEILLASDTCVSQYIRALAIRSVKSEKHLAHLKLILEEPLQRFLLQHIEKIRSQ